MRSGSAEDPISSNRSRSAELTLAQFSLSRSAKPKALFPKDLAASRHRYYESRKIVAANISGQLCSNCGKI